MKGSVNVLGLLLGLVLSHSSWAGLFDFAYVFDATASGTPGHILAGTVDGELQSDGDTIVVNDVLSASLGGFAYDISAGRGIRAADPAGAPRISLSGSTLDMWVCVQGFTSSFLGGGDCAFGNEGGFLISYDVEFGNGPTGGTAHAGIPDLISLAPNGNNFYRDSDLEINPGNWSASVSVPEPVSTLLLSMGLMLLFSASKRKPWSGRLS